MTMSSFLTVLTAASICWAALVATIFCLTGKAVSLCALLCGQRAPICALPNRQKLQIKGVIVKQEAGFPDINIITEKVAFEGVTRFEDRQRLPLGISFNSTSLSASLLIQAAYDPLARLANSNSYFLRYVLSRHPGRVQPPGAPCELQKPIWFLYSLHFPVSKIKPMEYKLRAESCTT